MDVKFFDMPDGMKSSFECAECGLGNCEVLVQENVFGGGSIAFHKTCLDNFLAREEEVPVENEYEQLARQLLGVFLILYLKPDLSPDIEAGLTLGIGAGLAALGLPSGDATFDKLAEEGQAFLVDYLEKKDKNNENRTG